MLIRMRHTTHYAGKLREAGTEHSDIPEAVVRRWQQKRIAEVVEVVEETSEPEITTSVYADMRAKELYGLCVEKGIITEPKQSKETYIALLEAQA